MACTRVWLGRYQSFLDSVTPPAWFQRVAADRQARRQAALDAWRAECDALAAHLAAAEAAVRDAEDATRIARTQQQYDAAQIQLANCIAALHEAQAAQAPPQPDLSAMDAEEHPMYFTDAQQLLRVLSRLQSRAVALVRSAQRAEQRVEGARAAQAEVRGALGGEGDTLLAEGARLAAALAAARTERQQLLVRQEGSGGCAAGKPQQPRGWPALQRRQAGC